MKNNKIKYLEISRMYIIYNHTMIYIILACIYSGFLLYNIKIVSNEITRWILSKNDTVSLNATNLIANESCYKKDINDFFYSEFYFNELYYNYQNDYELFVPLLIER
jgi:hypothetical protein